MQYFKNNVEAVVVTFAHCHALYMDYPAYYWGGPLFFKLLTDHLTASNERTKELLLKSVKAYKITNVAGEDIQIAYNQLLATAETLVVLNNGVLPPDMIKFISPFSQPPAVPSSTNSSRTWRNNYNIHYYNLWFEATVWLSLNVHNWLTTSTESNGHLNTA